MFRISYKWIVFSFIVVRVVFGSTKKYSGSEVKWNEGFDTVNTRDFYEVSAINITRYPYLAQVTLNGQIFLCFGTLISDTHVLTSSYCVFNHRNVPYEIWVYLGTTQIPLGHIGHRVENIHLHPNYQYEESDSSSEWPQYDLAILTLNKPLTFSDKISPVEVVGKNQVHVLEGFIDKRKECESFVWNWIEPSLVNADMISTHLLSAPVCSDIYRIKSNKTEICGVYSYFDPPCRKNIGSPIVCDGRLFGQHLWTKSCDKVPELFVRIDTLSDFVERFVTRYRQQTDGSDRTTTENKPTTDTIADTTTTENKPTTEIEIDTSTTIDRTTTENKPTTDFITVTSTTRDRTTTENKPTTESDVETSSQSSDEYTTIIYNIDIVLNERKKKKRRRFMWG